MQQNATPDCGSKFLAANNGNHFLVFEKKENEANYKGIFYLRNELLLDELISLQFNPYFSNIIMTVSVDKIKFYDYRIQRLGQDKSLIHSNDKEISVCDLVTRKESSTFLKDLFSFSKKKKTPEISDVRVVKENGKQIDPFKEAFKC